MSRSDRLATGFLVLSALAVVAMLGFVLIDGSYERGWGNGYDYCRKQYERHQEQMRLLERMSDGR